MRNFFQRFSPSIPAVFIILLVTGVVFAPLLSAPGRLISDDSDGLLGAWTIVKIQDNLLEGKAVFEGGIFFPQKTTLLFSDIFVTSALLALPLRLFTREPVTLFNYSLVSAFVLSAWAAYRLFLELLQADRRKDDWLALCLALIFSLSTIHFHYLGHLHMFALQYVLFSMGAFVRFLSVGKGGWLLISALFFLLQIWQSLFLGYYVIFFVLALVFAPANRKILMRRKTAVLLSLTVVFLGSLPIGLKYTEFYSTFHAVRDIREAIHFSLIFPDLWGKFFSPAAYVVIGLTLAAGFRRKKSILARCLIVLGGFAFIVSLGPALHWGAETVKFSLLGQRLHIPLPYALFYYLAPGFKAFRTPSRFMPLALLALLGVSGVLFSSAQWWRRLRLPLLVLALGLSLVTLIPVRFSPVPVTTGYPQYVRYLASRPEKVLIKLPIRDWGDPLAKEDVFQMLYALEHQKILVNGQSGFFPEEWLQFQHEVTVTFPAQESLALMKSRGVELVLLMKRYFPQFIPLPGTKVLYEDHESIILKWE